MEIAQFRFYPAPQARQPELHWQPISRWEKAEHCLTSSRSERSESAHTCSVMALTSAGVYGTKLAATHEREGIGAEEPEWLKERFQLASGAWAQ